MLFFTLSCRAIKLTHSPVECTYRIMRIFRKILVNMKKGYLEKEKCVWKNLFRLLCLGC